MEEELTEKDFIQAEYRYESMLEEKQLKYLEEKEKINGKCV